MSSKTRTWTAWGLVPLTALALAAVVHAQPAEEPISIRLLLPADAQVEIDGTKTSSTGESRLYTSPPVKVGREYHYTLKVLAGGKTVTRPIAVRPGSENTFDLRPDFQVAEGTGTGRGVAAGGQAGTPAGTLASAKGTLLYREAPGGKWEVLDAGGAVPAGGLLVGLPGAVVTSKDGAVELQFQTDFDSPFPVLECALTLHPSTEYDAEVTLDRGRVDLTNRKKEGAARVRLHSHDQTWLITLAAPETSLAVEVYGRWPRGSRFVKDAGPKDGPPAEMLFLALHGEVMLDFGGTAHRLTAPPGLALIQWDSGFGMDQAARFLKELPPWATRAGQKRSPEEQAKYKAARERLMQVAAEKGPDAALDALLNSDEPIDRRVGVIAAGALDELLRLGKFFQQTKHADLLDTAILVLRHWTGRGPGQDQKLYHALIEKAGFKPVQAESMLQMLHGFNDQELAQPETYELLISYLTDSRLAIRALAHWHLIRLVPAGHDIPYSPLDDKEALKKAQEAWQKLVPAGKVPERRTSSK
jgi:uncharacterized protein (TIGR03000 family)